MKRFRALWNVKVLLALVVIVVGVATYVASLPATDAVFCYGVSVYYSNATYKTVVGARGTGCCGEIINWGVITKYVKCERIYCLDVVCPIYQ
jgi:hypothetical protein